MAFEEKAVDRPEAYLTVAMDGSEGNAMLARSYGAHPDPRLRGFGTREPLSEPTARVDGCRSLTHIGDTTDTLSMRIKC